MSSEETAAVVPFRAEALQSYRQRLVHGEVLRLSPAWVDRTYWILVAALMTATVYVSIGTVNQYASGPAVIRIDDRIDLTFPMDGVVKEVRVQPGQHVAKGDLLVRLDDRSEGAELDSARREFDLELVQRLHERGPPRNTSLSPLLAKLSLTGANLRARSLRAPDAGTIADVRLRPGHRISAGEVVLSVVRDDASFSMIAVLPGRDRPLLRVGQPMLFEISGFADARQRVPISEIGDEVVGPGEVKRFLNPEMSDAFVVPGPSVLVTGSLSAGAFHLEGRRLRLYDGMQGTVDVAVRSEPLVFAFVPSLRRWIGEFEGGRP
ncbi:MAG TPA: HlyD family efflux transporter periplasmic adaptor subunit [Myxococcales bacterium]|jgi:membrane fusion protein (multidrug efflux system)